MRFGGEASERTERSRARACELCRAGETNSTTPALLSEGGRKKLKIKILIMGKKMCETLTNQLNKFISIDGEKLQSSEERPAGNTRCTRLAVEPAEEGTWRCPAVDAEEFRSFSNI